jgi:glutamine amidotransferase
MTVIALIDHGVGNIRSVEKALQAVGAQVQLTTDPAQLWAADKVVLPGVGAFGDCMRGVQSANLQAVIAELAQSKPLLGICVGMQMLFESSDELGQFAGLGLLAGKVTRFTHTHLHVPHTGWNILLPQRTNPLLVDLPSNSYAYFNHSYYCMPTDASDSLALTDYGHTYTSVVARGNVYGVQFHPEKSQQVGLQILRNFVEKC